MKLMTRWYAFEVTQRTRVKTPEFNETVLLWVALCFAIER